MTPDTLLGTLAGKWEDGTRPKDLFASYVSKDPHGYLPAILEGLKSKSRRVQGGSAEIASLLSEVHPDHFAPHIDTFLANLEAKAPILRWEAVCTVGNLATVDSSHKIPSHLETILAHLSSESIVLQGHAVRTLAKIADAFPSVADRVFQRLIASESHFPGSRIGFMIDVMPLLGAHSQLREPAMRFAEKWTASDVKVVASKARKALRALG